MLVEKGYALVGGLSYNETFSQMVKQVTIRVVLILALAEGWVIRQLDINNAFLNGKLKEDIYMVQPQGFVSHEFPHHVCKPKKALYGLKQASKTWFNKLSTCLM